MQHFKQFKQILLVFLWMSIGVQAKSLMFQPLDCADIYNDSSWTSGVYMIYPAGPNSGRYVHCDMYTDGGKWTVFQRRMDGTVNFYRGWDQYKNGFGHAAGEYWLGLETIHLLTLKKNYELRVDLEDFEGTKVYAKYKSFGISPMAINAELDGYKLHVSGFEDGGAGDSLSYHSGSKFSTFDKDQDAYEGNCASSYAGGYWYNSCYNSNLNGLYTWGGELQIGLTWRAWKGFKSVKSVSMMMRPVNLD
ncbi:microfibril-associated glycoprotein 4 isoform X1 [Pangasianodon hypophthalmus]|uniref:microfibril-associated glycoprotein 4 isoform X1 n=1 Tax=Pangasianodon hypophthalmus TaxID=310915 RepID=UPI0023081BF5|nr:microfibril-associated glycoprotein 4 isoform X1 [Pangasianodon hypophthalmus]